MSTSAGRPAASTVRRVLRSAVPPRRARPRPHAGRLTGVGGVTPAAYGRTGRRPGVARAGRSRASGGWAIPRRWAARPTQLLGDGDEVAQLAGLHLVEGTCSTWGDTAAVSTLTRSVLEVPGGASTGSRHARQHARHPHTHDNSTGTALVTGANKGIGYEIAAGLARRGFRVGVGTRDAGRRGGGGQAAGRGLDVFGVALDVTDDTSMRRRRGQLEAEGGLDVLVSQRGHHRRDAPGAERGHARAGLGVVDTNVVGVIRVTNAMLLMLRRAASPRIVNVSSTVGSLTPPDGEGRGGRTDLGGVLAEQDLPQRRHHPVRQGARRDRRPRQRGLPRLASRPTSTATAARVRRSRVPPCSSSSRPCPTAARAARSATTRAPALVMTAGGGAAGRGVSRGRPLRRPGRRQEQPVEQVRLRDLLAVAADQQVEEEAAPRRAPTGHGPRSAPRGSRSRGTAR